MEFPLYSSSELHINNSYVYWKSRITNNSTVETCLFHITVKYLNLRQSAQISEFYYFLSLHFGLMNPIYHYNVFRARIYLEGNLFRVPLLGVTTVWIYTTYWISKFLNYLNRSILSLFFIHQNFGCSYLDPL